jgi:hypothetical protein
MKAIRMMFQGEVQMFRITYECPEYIFCECLTKPEARGFYTIQYILKNKVD